MKFYVYTYAFPDGRVFYVGKGTGYRMNSHESLARSMFPGPTYDVIRQITESGNKPLKTVVFETDNETEAFKVEVQLINHYGLANLTNKNSGGAGGISGDSQPVTTIKINSDSLDNLRAIHNLTGESLQDILDRLIKTELSP